MTIIKDYKNDRVTFLQKLTGSKDVISIPIEDVQLLSNLSKFPYLVTVVNDTKDSLLILLPSKEQVDEANG